MVDIWVAPPLPLACQCSLWMPPRVNAKHKYERISLVSFWAPNYETLLPDPKAVTKNVFCGEYYMKRNNMI